MISVRNIKKIYPTRTGDNLVLDGINFNLAMGERLGILGRNGAGKSTLVRLVSGAERPTSGTIESSLSISWPLAFGGAFQYDLTGSDNVRFISRIYQQDAERNLAYVEEFAELGPYLREPLRSYSSGMKARLAFAVSMIIEFDCFLIDEIASVGDARFHNRCNFELFEKRGDRAMVIISHDATYIRDHCNRYAVLDRGKLSLFDDFDVSYDFFSEIIELATSTVGLSIRSTGRAAALSSMYHLAIADERFRVHVQQGDWARDQHDWAKAELQYGKALAMHPYERTYWAQMGHVLREQGKYIGAEICYRSACALGLPARDLQAFVDYCQSHSCSEPSEEVFPIYSLGRGPTAEQPPSYSDICILTRAFWGATELDNAKALNLLRTCPTLDDLVEDLLSDRRAKRSFEVDLITSNEYKILNDNAIFTVDNIWLQRFSYISMPILDLNSVDKRDISSDFEKFLAIFIERNNGFREWPKSLPKISEFIEKNRTQPSVVSKEKKNG